MASRVRNKLLIKETRRGDLDRATELIRAGAEINKLASDGNTALMRAASYGYVSLVEMLLREGAEPNKTAHDGASALFWACRGGHEAVADLLIAAGADVNAARDTSKWGGDGVGPSVLNVAISHAPASLVEKLVRAGAALDYRYQDMDAEAFAERYRPEMVPVLKPRKRGR